MWKLSVCDLIFPIKSLGSLGFIKSNALLKLDLMKPKDPNELIEKVKSHTNNFHIYTFGGLKETNKWLMENKYV